MARVCGDAPLAERRGRDIGVSTGVLLRDQVRRSRAGLRVRFKIIVAQPFRAAGAAVGRPKGLRYERSCRPDWWRATCSLPDVRSRCRCSNRQRSSTFVRICARRRATGGSMFRLSVLDHVRLNFDRTSQNYTVHAKAAERLAALTATRQDWRAGAARHRHGRRDDQPARSPTTVSDRRGGRGGARVRRARRVPGDRSRGTRERASLLRAPAVAGVRPVSIAARRDRRRAPRSRHHPAAARRAQRTSARRVRSGVFPRSERLRRRAADGGARQRRRGRERRQTEQHDVLPASLHADGDMRGPSGPRSH